MNSLRRVWLCQQPEPNSCSSLGSQVEVWPNRVKNNHQTRRSFLDSFLFWLIDLEWHKGDSWLGAVKVWIKAHIFFKDVAIIFFSAVISGAFSSSNQKGHKCSGSQINSFIQNHVRVETLSENRWTGKDKSNMYASNRILKELKDDNLDYQIFILLEN